MTHVRTALQAKQLKDKTLLISQKPVRLVGKALELQQGEENLLQRFVKRRRDQLRETKSQVDDDMPSGEGQANGTIFVLRCPHCQNERCPTGKFNLVEGKLEADPMQHLRTQHLGQQMEMQLRP